MAEQQKAWDTAYEWKAVTLLGLAFGLVGLDRWIIAPLLPSIMKDLNLDYQRTPAPHHRRSAWPRLGRFRDLDGRHIGPDRTPQSADPRHPRLLAAVGILRHGHRPFEPDPDSHRDGLYGRFLLPDQLCRDQRRLASEAPGDQSGPAAVRVRALRSGGRAHYWPRSCSRW